MCAGVAWGALGHGSRQLDPDSYALCASPSSLCPNIAYRVTVTPQLGTVAGLDLAVKF